LQDILGSLNKVSDSISKTKSSADEASVSTGKLASAFAVAGLAVDAIESSLTKVEAIFSDSIKTATDYQRSLQGVQAVGAELGQSTDQITAAVKRLTNDGLLNTKQAADALRNVMQRGFNVEEATKAVEAMKNFGSFGKKSQEDLGAAIDSATLGWRHQRSVMMENAGFLETFQQVWQKYADSQGRSVASLSDAEKHQAELNAVLAQGATAAGDAATYAASAAGQQEIFANKTLDAKAALGDALLPAFQLVERSLLGGLIPATKDGQNSMVGLQQTFLSLGVGVGEAANILTGFTRIAIGAFQAISSESMDPLNQAWNGTVDSMKTTWTDYVGTMDKIAKGGFDAVKGSQLGLNDDLAAANRKGLTKMREQIADANKAFQEADAKRKESFIESMQQMVQSHQDKVSTIKEQLASEQSSYDDAIKSRKDNYDEQVSSAEDAHKQKVEDITQQISDERAKGIYVDGNLVANANAKKLEKLQDTLEKEKAAYVVHTQKLKDTYDDQVKTAQAAFDKKKSALQESLDKEQAILRAHAAEVAQFSQRQNEDDISRAQRKYAEEGKLAQQHLDDQLARIRRSAEDQGIAMGRGIARGVASSIEPVKQAMTKMGNDASSALQQGFASGGLSKGGGSSSGGRSLIGDIGNLFNGLGNWWEHLGDGRHYASGTLGSPGGWSVVGEQGPEMVNLSPGSQVMNAGQTRNALGGQGANYTFNHYGDIRSGIDIKSAFREMGFMVTR